MAKIAFLLMAHKDPDRVIAQARALSAHGDCVAIHYDARAARADWDRLCTGVAGLGGVALARRVRCGWGEWSLVQASLNLITTARGRFTDITHYYLISGDCYPTKSRGHADKFLADNANTDFIETHDFFESDWIKTGIKRERLIYRHYFNERQNKRMFYLAMAMQERLGLDRALPSGLRICIGSQWWLLRAATVERLVGFLRQRRDIMRFFRTTWIPDETFFQSLVAHLVPRAEISGSPPTHLVFSDYGMPVVFYHDHADYLRGQDKLFARKLSAHAPALREQMLALWTAWEDPTGRAAAQPTALYPYLAGRGRRGDRYAPRFWQSAIDARADGEMLIVAAKLWHVGKAVERAIHDTIGIPALGYLFDEDTPLPLDLGNLEQGLAKRGRHRRALMNLIFDAVGTNRVLLCIDPSRLDVVNDLVGAVGSVRLLAIDRPIPDSHVINHAARVGLIGPASGAFEQREAVTALTHEFNGEIAALARAHRSILYRNDLTRTREANVIDIGQFLRCPRDAAEAIARMAEQNRG